MMSNSLHCAGGIKSNGRLAEQPPDTILSKPDNPGWIIFLSSGGFTSLA